MSTLFDEYHLSVDFILAKILRSVSEVERRNLLPKAKPVTQYLIFEAGTGSRLLNSDFLDKDQSHTSFDSLDNSNRVAPIESRSLCEQPTLTPNTTNSSGVFFGSPTPHAFDMNVTPIKSPNGHCLSKPTGLTSSTESARHAFLEAGSMCKSPNSSIIESYPQESLPPTFICSWSAEKVANWLTECDLSNFTKALDGLDGCLLWELARQRIVAPESFYAHLRSDLGMTMIERLRLSFALSRLSILRED
nr:unnamed protein product [Spirometra erinaceieuropaei]